MRQIIGKSLLGLLAATPFIVLAPGTAQAASSHGGGYPAFAYEGQFPTVAACSGTFREQQSRTAVHEGRTVRLKYFYSDKCGSFARIENAPRDCSVFLDRDADANPSNGWAWVRETVDSGDDFAYTKMGNNLNGRLSRGSLVCDNRTLTQTSWY